jgi:hypothetical protein
MVNVSNTHAVRPPQAQAARQGRDHQTNQSHNQHAGTPPTVRGQQRRAGATSRLAKATVRCPEHEATGVRRANDGNHTGPQSDARDPRGEVA